MREIHAVPADAVPAFFDMLAAALDGTGPALLPLPPGPHTIVESMRPTQAGGSPYPGGTGTDAAVIIATSGSTGAPKGVELSAAALLASARASLARLGAAPGDRWLCCLPVSHVSGLQVLVRSLLLGNEPIMHGHFDARAVLDSEATHVSLVPTQLQRLVDLGAGLEGRTVLLGGAAAPPDLLQAARTAGGRIVRTYGMSETCGGCVYDGLPLDGVDVGIENGLIRLAGPMLFDGYRFGPRAGSSFLTSDLGALDGERLRVLGRADDVINTGGEKVVPGLIERVLGEHPGISEIVVVGRPDAEWGERVTAVVVPDGPAPALGELRAFARDRLPPAALPRDLEVIDAIPTLPSGKPDRQALRGRASEGGRKNPKES